MNSILVVTILSLLVLPFSWASNNDTSVSQKLFKCLSATFTNLSASFIPQSSPNFTQLLESTAQNLRYTQPSQPKPQLIFTPLIEKHVQFVVSCANKLGVRIRVRSGGHDYEANSYASTTKSPFVVIDLSKLKRVDVDADGNTAWAQAGSTIGQVYYTISQKSTNRGFPAGLFTSLGIGGHITGGAYGGMMRKYGLGADNVADVRIVDANGRILDRKALGEDVFWALRGGAGGSFGVILAWKLNLVPVPPVVTVFTISRPAENRLLTKWQQIADTVDDDLFTRVMIQPVNSTSGRTVQASFNSLFLGGADRLFNVMWGAFPELNLTRADLVEKSWIESVLYSGGYPEGAEPQALLQGKAMFRNAFKAKSDFVTEVIPEAGLDGIRKRLLKEENPLIIWNAWGGKMSRIPESKIAFPHRNGIKFMAQYLTRWGNGTRDSAAKHHVSWVRELYSFLTPYVSKNPRRAYANYRDYDLGVNRKGVYNFAEASSFGTKYFNRNFKRLALAKAKVDPGNFFRHEQSIPPQFV